MLVANRLKELREQKKLSIDEAAYKLGMKRETIIDFETVGGDPRASIVAKLATFYKVSVDYLLGLSKESGRDQFTPTFKVISARELMETPEWYKVKYPRQNDTGEHRILSNCGQWAVTEFGIECLHGPIYYIPKEEVFEEFWAKHMSQKDWVDMHSFLTALDRAYGIFAE